MAEEIKQASNIDADILQEYQDFAICQKWHKMPLQQFNSSYDGSIRDLVSYIDYSVKKFNQTVNIPADTEDYEVHLALPDIRNKLMAIMARLSAQRMKAELFPENLKQMIDKVVSKLASNLLEWSDDESNQDVQNLYWMLETAIKGTGILMEDYYKYSREIKDIGEVEAETSKVKWKKKKIVKDGCYSQVIPLEEFYIWNLREPDIQKQYKVYWVTTMNLADFKIKFKKYKKVDEVAGKGAMVEQDKMFANTYLTDVEANEVQVMRMWCKDKDEFKIIANGVELTEKDNPIPFKHKDYPFIKNVYALIQADFFYGKSLPDILANLSDCINQLFNDLFNRNTLARKAPLLVKKGSVTQNSIWRPDNIIYYNGEKPEALMIGSVGNDFDRAMNILQEQLHLSSIQPIGQGQVTSGVTARAAILAEEHSNELLTLFLRFMEWGEKERVKLRISNLFQFLTKEIKSNVGGEASESFDKEYRSFKQYGVMLENGKMGTREIQIRPAYAITPPQILEKEKASENYEYYEIDEEFIRNLSWFVKIVPNSSIKISKALTQALELEYQNTMNMLYPDKLDRDEGFKILNESFDKDAENMRLKQENQPKSPTTLDEEFNAMAGSEKSPLPQLGNTAGKLISNAAIMPALGKL